MWTCCLSWVRHKGHAIAVSSGPLLSSHRTTPWRLEPCMHTQWVTESERNLHSGKYQSFIMGGRQPCSIIFLGGIGTISKQSSSPSILPFAGKHSEIQAWREQAFRSNYSMRVVTCKHKRNFCHSRCRKRSADEKFRKRHASWCGCPLYNVEQERNAMDALRSYVRSGRSQPVLCHWLLRGKIHVTEKFNLFIGFFLHSN